MTFWIGIAIAMVTAIALLTSKDVYYVRQGDESLGLVIGTVAITLAIMRLLP